MISHTIVVIRGTALDPLLPHNPAFIPTQYQGHAQQWVLMDLPELPESTDAAVAGWMKRHGWSVIPARWEKDPNSGFYVWQEDVFRVGRPHALWVEGPMIRRLSADELLRVLDREGVAEEIRVNLRVRIQERGDEYRVSPVPRRSGEVKKPEE